MTRGLVIYLVLALLIGAAGIVLGDRIGLEMVYRAVIAVVLLVPVPLVFILRARKKSATKTALTKPKKAVAPPELVGRFRAKIGALEKVLDATRLAGDKSLLLLPRALVIGPPGSGKSSAIHRSRLDFPFTTVADGKTGELEIWLARQGTLIDVSGRFFAADSGPDHAAWLELLAMLDRRRRGTVALEAVLCAIPIDEIIAGSADAAEELAAKTRRRVLEVIDAVGWSMPVYVLFTKADRFSGFVESFAVLPSAERAQPLGFVLDREGNAAAELARLVENVRTEAHIRLGHLDPAYRAGTFSFPEQLAAAEEPLEIFLRRLVEPNAVGDSAHLAGVHLASAVQDGKTIDRVFDRLSRSFAIGGAPNKAPRAEEAKSFFLHELFLEVVLGRPWPLSRSELGRRRRVSRVAISTAIAVVGALFLGGLSGLAYLKNSGLIASTVEVARAVGAPRTELSPSDYQRLTAIVPLAQRIDELETWEADGRPLFYGFGFYAGSAILVPLRRTFERAMEEMFVDRVGIELESMLGDQTGSGDVVSDYDVLKAYLMLTREKARLEPEVVTRVLVDVWKRRLDTTASTDAELLTKLAGTYVRQVGRDTARWPTPSETLIGDARASLRRRSAEFERMVASARKKAGRPLTLSELVGGRVPDSLRSGREVDRLYTLDGWRSVRGSFEETPDGAEFWVLGEFATNEEMVAKAEAQYFEKYIAEWHRFQRDLSIREARSLPDAKRVLDELTQRPSILELVFKGMKSQMTFPAASDDALAETEGKKIPKVPAKALTALKTIGAKTREKTPVELEFAPLFELVDPAPDAAGNRPQPAIGTLLDKLGAVKGALEKLTPDAPDTRELQAAAADAKNAVDTVFLTVPENLAKLVKPLFYDALRGVTQEAETEKYLRANQAFTEKVCDLFHETLVGRYPFDRSSADDALFDSVTQFFGPGGAAFAFYDATLKDDLIRVGDGVEAKPKSKVERPVVEFYKKAFLVKGSLFPGDAPSLEREIQVRPQGVAAPPEANVKATGVTLEIGGEKRTYRFGPQETWSFPWPSKIGRARLSLEGANESLETWGDWALFRLMDKGTIKPLSGGWIEVRFPFKNGQVQVPLQFRTTGTLNPLLEHQRFKVPCPKSQPKP